MHVKYYFLKANIRKNIKFITLQSFYLKVYRISIAQFLIDYVYLLRNITT